MIAAWCPRNESYPKTRRRTPTAGACRSITEQAYGPHLCGRYCQAVIAFENPFHTGLVVADVEAAMAHFSRSFGVEWLPVVRASVATEREGVAEDVNVTFTYTRRGPLRLEIACGDPGSIWDPALCLGTTHLGYWSTDLEGDVAALVATGHSLVLSASPRRGARRSLVYLRGPSGNYIELLSDAGRPHFERWFAGGSWA